MKEINISTLTDEDYNLIQEAAKELRLSLAAFGRLSLTKSAKEVLRGVDLIKPVESPANTSKSTTQTILKGESHGA